MPTEQQVADVVLPRIRDELTAPADAFEAHEVPAERPDEYVVVTVVRRGGGTPRGGRYDTTGWSIYAMAASHTAVQNARASLREVAQALEAVVLEIGGVTSTPLKFDSARPVAPDDGWFSGVNVYNFTL